jgi:hypothetical protein
MRHAIYELVIIDHTSGDPGDVVRRWRGRLDEEGAIVYQATLVAAANPVECGAYALRVTETEPGAARVVVML